jgi:precorrin-4 C11-methyltransferase
MKQEDIALIAVTERGCEQARLLRQRLRRGALYRSARYGKATHPWEHVSTAPLADVVGELFAEHEQLVFFLAAGAVVRLIAPHLRDKSSDPGVLAIDESGQFVIPLLSGHQGGANAFARIVAGCLGAVPVVTTASDAAGGLSLDTLAEEQGWVAEPREQLKPMALALVNGAAVAVVQEIGGRGCWLDELGLPDDVAYVNDAARLPDRPFAGSVWITDRLVSEMPEPVLYLRPRSLVLGIGCERGVSLEALEDAVQTFLAAHGFAESSIAVLASVTLKEDEAGLVALARERGWETVFYAPDELARVERIPTPSDVVARCIGTPGVAEPAALLASGSDRLLVTKRVVASPLAPQRITLALARAARYTPRAAGGVMFVSAGPGDPELLTVKARRLLQSADVVVYAGSLIPEQVLRQARHGAALHNSAYLTLEQVMDITLNAARAGKQVVRLHSGDTSLYSAIQEQMQVLDEAAVDYDVIPGVSSFQAAAAALRSELTLPEVVQTVILTRAEGTTPMPAREKLAALAQHGATLCIFLSARLGEQVQEALLFGYAPDAPVALVHRVSWPDAEIVMTRLDRLALELESHAFERTTLMLVGPAIAARGPRSRLYDRGHGHIFRKRSRAEDHPAP